MVRNAAIRWRLMAAALAVAVGVSLCAAPGQQTAEPVGPVGGEEGSAVLLDRQPVPITPPVSAAPVKGRQQLPPDLPIVDRRCRMKIDSESGWAVLEFENAPTLAPLGPHRVLPCQRLESMEQLLAKDPGVVFRVSGEVTVYQRQAHILPRTLGVETAAAMPGAAAPAPVQPAPPAEAAADDAAASSEGLIKVLTRNRPAKPVLMPAAHEELAPDTQSVAPPPEEQAAPDRPGIVVDRLVRAVRGADGPWWEVRFESDNTLSERPLRLLPCRLLEQAQRAPGRIVITGEITFYKGRTYLLLRKVLPERDMGQLQ